MQATFLVLVRKAGTIKERESLASWLYSVAYRTSLQARSRSGPPTQGEGSRNAALARQRRRRRGGRQFGTASPARPRTEPTAGEIPAPVVLCDLLGKTKRQAAEELGCPEGTLSSRLARGSGAIAAAARRPGPAAGGLAGANLLELGGSALPPLLASATAKAAVLIANGTTAAAGLTPNVAALMQGVMKSMLLTRLLPPVAVVLAVLVLGGSAGLVASGWGARRACRSTRRTSARRSWSSAG